MSTAPLAATTATRALLADAADRAQDYAAAAKAPNTLRGYRTDWRHFTAWCERHGVSALPASPETVGLYLSAAAGQRKTGRCSAG